MSAYHEYTLNTNQILKIAESLGIPRDKIAYTTDGNKKPEAYHIIDKRTNTNPDHFEKELYRKVRYCKPDIRVNFSDLSKSHYLCSNCGDSHMDPHDNFL